MQRSPLFGMFTLALGLSLLLAGSGFSKAPAPSDLRTKSQQAMANGNFKDALAGYKQLVEDAKTDPRQVSNDLAQAVICLYQLGMYPEVDTYLESAVKTHSQNWRLLQAAAQQYINTQHQGFIIAGKFERGPHRGGGKFVSTQERDRVRAMQLFNQALPLANQDDNKADVSQFYLEYSRLLLNNRGIYDAWRLQYLTDLTQLPDYEEGYNNGRPYNGAPVDAEGKPIFHLLPKSWEAAATDGERWRWLQLMAIENSPAQKDTVMLEMAQFFDQMYGVQSLQFGQWRGGGTDDSDDDTKKNESGTYALHTLKEDESITKLANGIKRLTLPDEFNALKIYQQIANNPKSGQSEAALNALCDLFENRRQYPRAAEYWKVAIGRHGVGDQQWRQLRLDQILRNWGTFESVSSQPAGQGATVDFRFRNAKGVKFTAKAVKVEQLLADVKAYLKSDPGNQIDWNRVNIGNIGYQLVEGNAKKYVGDQVATWNLALEPREKHFDKRITVATPLQKAGAYFVTAEVEGGNTSHILLWVTDTAIVKKQLDGKTLYFIADALSGSPIEAANLEFFGWQQRHLGNNKFQVNVTQFAEFTNADGICLPSEKDLKNEYQWLITARTKQGRFSYQGFVGVWTGRRHDPEYNAVKVFSITDRPVYRTNQKVEFKLWVRHAKYDQPDVSDFAKRSFTIELHNPKGDKISSQTIEADEYAGVSGSYDLPADATLGQYQLTILPQENLQYQQIGGNTFRVEEYKKPEFEVKVIAPTEPVMLGEKILAKIDARYYFGSPVSKAKVKYKIERTDYADSWYPVGNWDWCFGSGYWWFGYDYPWYKGWNQWAGCRRPLPPWHWHGHQQPPELVADIEREIGEDGTISFEIDSAIAKELHGNTDHEYTITAEVRDESRRTTVGTGKVLVARKPFKVFSWTDRGYYRTGDVIEAQFTAQTLDRKPVPGKGKLKLLKITYDKKRQPIETAVQEWPLDTDAQGVAKQQMNATEAGQYRLSYTVTDSQGHAIEGGYIFTIIGANLAAGDFRFNQLELIPDKREYRPGESIKLQINADRADGTVLLFLRPTNGVYLPPKVIRLKGKTTVAEIAVATKDMPNFFVEALTVSGAKLYTETKEIIVPPESRVLNVEVLPSAKEYLPGQKAKVKIRLTDHTGENYVGSTVLSIYDKSVEYISGGSNVPDIKEFFWKWRRQHNPQQEENLTRYEGNIVPTGKPGMSFLGIFGNGVAEEAEGADVSMMLGDGAGLGGGGMGGGGGGMNFGAMAGRRGMAMAKGAMTAPGAPMMLADAAAAAPMAAGEALGFDKSALQSEKQASSQQGGQGAAPLVQPTVRSNFADTAKWVAALTTGKDGTAEVELDMPENLTAWKIRVWGIGHGTRVGSGEADIVTRKNLIVRLQAPRFFVQTDEVVLSANVHNYLPTAKEVAVELELPGKQLESLVALTQTVQIPAGGEKRVDWRCKVLTEGNVVVRMKALTDEESDAMELTLPSFIHGIFKTESWAGTVRPDKDSSRLVLQVPKERIVDQSRLEIRYSPSLAMAMVDALPYMAEYPYGCTEQTLNRFLPSVITQKTLLEMKLNLADIGKKRTNLNAQEIGVDTDRAKQWKRFDTNPVFDEDELARMVKEGVKALTEQQISDGGWGWFSGAGERSWPHTTSVVVHGLQLAQANDVALVPGVLERGIEWLVRYQAEQIELIKNKDNKDPKVPRKQAADSLDAFCYMILVDAAKDSQTMRDFLYRDRIHLPVYAKGMFGLALEKIGDKEKLTMILENISQFLVEDAENETAYLKLPEDNYWWHWYGSEVEANAYYLKLLARTDAKGIKAPRLVKYLLNNRKHATYWRSTRDSSVCVEAFADYIRASGESEPEMLVEVWVDGEKKQEVQINRENLFTFENKFVLTGKEVTSGKHEVELRRKGTGSIYFNAYLTNFTLEDQITRAGLEVKVNREFYKLTKVDKTIKAEGVRGQALDQKVEKYVRTKLDNLATLKSGDLVEVELEIDSKNDYEYILFEDMKASGFEAVDVRSGYNGNSLGAYMELRDNRVSFFVRQLARGKHSVSYRLRAETPGKFSALPAQASAMYAPELKGNSDEMKVQVED